MLLIKGFLHTRVEHSGPPLQHLGVTHPLNCDTLNCVLHSYETRARAAGPSAAMPSCVTAHHAQQGVVLLPMLT